MVQVVVNEGDDLERVLRRFKRQVQRAGIFTDLKRKKHYEKPSETRKRKRNAARRRSRRTRHGGPR
jgi:small subunit ribosomal protein S21